MSKALDPVEKLHRELTRLRLENQNLRSLNKKLLVSGDRYDQFLEDLETVLQSDKNFKFKSSSAKKTPTPFDKNHEEVAAVAVSDLHLSETVNLTESNGINVYNSMIASNRLWEHSQKVKSILARHQSMYKISEIWSLLLGDMISGSIHPEYLTTNDLSDMAASVLCSRLLRMFYEELKTLGIPIHIDSIHGNHPRLSAKMPTKKQAHTNMDWLIYEMLSDSFKKDDQVSMTIHTSQIGMRKVYDWNYVFEHGMSVASGAEESFEDRVRAMFDDPTFRQATGYSGPAFDQIVIGNMHKPKFLERTTVNGSYIGQNELGQSWRLKPIKAQQLMWGISKKYVRTWQYNVDLTDVRSDKPINPFSEYTQWFMRTHCK